MLVKLVQVAEQVAELAEPLYPERCCSCDWKMGDISLCIFVHFDLSPLTT